MSDTIGEIAQQAAHEVSEKVFTAQVVQLARIAGFKVFHPWLSIHSAQGFPDLTFVKESVWFAELKSEKGKLTEKQQEWIAALIAAGAEVYTWRPSQWQQIEDRLLRGKRR